MLIALLEIEGYTRLNPLSAELDGELLHAAHRADWAKRKVGEVIPFPRRRVDPAHAVMRRQLEDIIERALDALWTGRGLGSR